jgi:hypothetical protein
MRRTITLARLALVYELNMWRSLYRWILRKPPTGGRPFRYAAPVIPIIWTFIVLSAIEIPMADLLLPWQSLRIALLALGAWGLTWMIGLLASMYVNPHAVGDAGLRVRYGLSVDFTVPWTAIASIRPNSRPLQSSRTVQFEQTSAGLVLSVAVGSQTAVDITLHNPMVVRLPSGDSKPVVEIRVNADDAEALVAAARQHVATDQTAAA